MVISNRKIANKSIFNSSAMFSPNDSNNVSEDITMNSPRGRSNTYSKTSSQSNSTVSSFSNVSSINHGTYIEIQSNDPN